MDQREGVGTNGTIVSISDKVVMYVDPLCYPS
jgi:hypothetical protein